MNLDELDNYEFTLPSWLKNTSKFWISNSITDQEFINAIEYLLEIQVLDASFLYRSNWLSTDFIHLIRFYLNSTFLSIGASSRETTHLYSLIHSTVWEILR